MLGVNGWGLYALLGFTTLTEPKMIEQRRSTTQR